MALPLVEELLKIRILAQRIDKIVISFMALRLIPDIFFSPLTVVGRRSISYFSANFRQAL